MKNPFAPRPKRRPRPRGRTVFMFLNRADERWKKKRLGKSSSRIGDKERGRRFKTLGTQQIEFCLDEVVKLDRSICCSVDGTGIEKNGYGDVWGVFLGEDEDRNRSRGLVEGMAYFRKLTLLFAGGPEICFGKGMRTDAVRDIPLRWAVERGDIESIKYSLRHRNKGCLIDDDIVFMAVENENLEILEFLIDYDGVFVTPEMIDHAEEYGHQDSEEYDHRVIAGFLMKKFKEQERAEK